MGQKRGRLTCKNMNNYHSANECEVVGISKYAFLGIYNRMS